MENEESIYNLIPREQYVAPKDKRHKSKYDPKLPPSCSTFGLQTTSKPGVSNVNGDFVPEGSNHVRTAARATFGAPKGALKPDQNTFRKKGTGTMKLNEPQKFHYGDNFKKPAIPKKDEKPIQGLVSDKNYIVANAVENILAAPKLPVNKDKDFLKKKNYGKTPKYIQNIKKEIEDEYQLVRELQIEEENQRDQ